MMKRYENYKDSGVEWIGEIPVHWELTKVKFVINPKGYKAGPFGSSLITSELLLNGTIKVFSPEHVAEKEISEEWYLPENRAEEMSQFMVKDKDVVLPIVGTLGLARVFNVSKDGIGIINQRLARISCNPSKLIPEFFCSLMKDTSNYQEYFHLKARGSILSHLNKETIVSMPIVIPDIEEQKLIINYLDRKTAQIDDLIAKKERLIQLLEEERIAMINQAVTKGLDPTVPMKDSGIEWLGEIPEHWKCYRIDWVTNIVRGNTGFRRDELLDSGEYIALQYGKTYKVDIVDERFKFFVNNEFYKESQIVFKGDTILISTSETIEDLGHTCYYNIENVGLLGGEQILLKPNREILYEKYLYQYARQFCLELRKYAKGLKVFRFNINDLKQIFIAIPSIEEQIRIVNFLDCETIRLENLTSKMKQEISLLKEYKTALISEVVTGKVDVSAGAT